MTSVPSENFTPFFNFNTQFNLSVLSTSSTYLETKFPFLSTENTVSLSPCVVKDQGVPPTVGSIAPTTKVCPITIGLSSVTTFSSFFSPQATKNITNNNKHNKNLIIFFIFPPCKKFYKSLNLV